MNTTPDRPENPWTRGMNAPVPAPSGSPAPGHSRGRGVALVTGVLVLALCVAAGVWSLTRDGDDAGTADEASPNFTGAVETPSDVVDATGTGAGQTVTTVTVTEETPVSELHAPTAEPSPLPGNASGSGPLPCDGRGVLIVNSVYSNSPVFQQEVDAALAQDPRAVVLPPGSCPSLRPHADGADIYAVVVDYGGDLSSLCAAEVPGTRNARLLNGDTSYRSPC